MELIEEYCPLPMGSTNWLLSWPALGVIGLVTLRISVFIFTWWTGQRAIFAFRCYIESLLVTQFLDSQKLYEWPFIGKFFVHTFFDSLQNRAPIPPQHLMSSAPSNCPGILTVLPHKNPLNSKNSGMLTSDDFPVLPAQPRIFRTVDGFGNCPYSPHIGQAAQPYSYVMTSRKPVLDAGGKVVEPSRPSEKDIFEKLLLRKKFEPNEAGLNCLILDFATLLTHDLFNSKNGFNANSSYADLSPLYGNDADSARRVRKFKRGLLDLTKVPYSRAATSIEKVQERLLTAKREAVERATGRSNVTKNGDVTNKDDDSNDDDVRKLIENGYLTDLMKAADDNNWDWGFVGWRALVELFGREHNWVARHLLKWYPKRFSHRLDGPHKDGPHKDVSHMCNKYDHDGEERLNADEDSDLEGELGAAAHAELRGTWINDEALYQTARYITTRIYANIILTDYASNFLGLEQLNDFFGGRPQQLGNSCSYEFGLLYHWHCLLPDDTAAAKVTRGVPCPRAELNEKRGPLDGDYYDKFDKLGEDEFGNDKVPPKDRTFLKLLGLKKCMLEQEARDKHAELNAELNAKRDGHATPPAEVRAETLAEFIDHLPDTSLNLERLLLSRYNTRIGRFGANHTPEYMRAAEMKTLEKARAQGIGSYNDFREHVNQWRCTTYEEINPDPEVAKILRELYEQGGKGNDHVDDVELYPGVFAERAGKDGIKFGQILSMGLLEDALNLIRNDRLVIDFDSNTATAKGYQHAVTSHFADVIERNTGLRLVKQHDETQLVDYKSSHPRGDWRAWRLASCALLTVPDEKVTPKSGYWAWFRDGVKGLVPGLLKPKIGRDAIFSKTKCQPGVLAHYVDHAASKREALKIARAESGIARAGSGIARAGSGNVRAGTESAQKTAKAPPKIAVPPDAGTSGDKENGWSPTDHFDSNALGTPLPNGRSPGQSSASNGPK